MVARRRAKKTENLRIKVLFYLYGFILSVFLIRLFNIQVLNHDRYSALAQGQYWNLSVIPAERGDIITSDSYTLAGTQTHYLLYVEPHKIQNKHEVSHQLSDFLSKLNSDEEDQKEAYFDNNNRILDLLNTDLYWAVVEHNLTPHEKQLLEEKNISGIGFEEEPVRYYPEGNLASHVLGFVAFNENGDKQGYFGVEGSLNGDLRGKPGRILDERDALGNPILIGSYKKSESIKGRDIVLTLNRAVQYIVEKKLKEGVENYDAKSGCVIVMDPFTGEVVAMANYPSYKPDFYEEDETGEKEDNEIIVDSHRKSQERVNLCISQTYEPGSVIKAFTVSSAIELKKVSPDTTFVDGGPVQYSDYVIDNWDGKHHGVQTISQLLEKSNNIGAAWVGHLVGSKDLSYYFSEFGLGRKTEVELEGEDTGVIRDYLSWTDIDLATAAFGQGISATPLQVLNGFNSIANGGFLLQPKIISKIIDEEKVIDIPTKHIKRVISKETSGTMVDLLVNAVESGEAKYFVSKKYTISGKTGTAQIPVEGKYDPEKTNATFLGFLAESKKFSMIVKLEEPRASVYAAETSVPLWMDIASELVKYYGIPPDKQ